MGLARVQLRGSRAPARACAERTAHGPCTRWLPGASPAARQQGVGASQRRARGRARAQAHAQRAPEFSTMRNTVILYICPLCRFRSLNVVVPYVGNAQQVFWLKAPEWGLGRSPDQAKASGACNACYARGEACVTKQSPRNCWVNKLLVQSRQHYSTSASGWAKERKTDTLVRGPPGRVVLGCSPESSGEAGQRAAQGLRSRLARGARV